MTDAIFDLTVPTETADAPVQTQIVTVDDGQRMIVDLTSRSTSYSSMVATTDEEKATLYAAMNTPDGKLMEHIGEIINLKDVYVEAVQCTNEETGEIIPCPRIVLIDANGKSYQCVSKGVFGSLKKLFTVYGEPKSWTNPIPLKVRLIPLGTRNVLTLDIIRPGKTK